MKASHIRGITRPIVLVVLALGIAIPMTAWRQTAIIGVSLLAALSITVFFCNLIWQYGKIDSITGGIPRALAAYYMAFTLLLAGYVLAVASFATRIPILTLLSGFSIVAGIILAQFSNMIVLQHISTGRRWRLAQSSGGLR